MWVCGHYKGPANLLGKTEAGVVEGLLCRLDFLMSSNLKLNWRLILSLGLSSETESAPRQGHQHEESSAAGSSSSSSSDKKQVVVVVFLHSFPDSRASDGGQEARAIEKV
eukprot:CAMPEP_0206622022 /NCGR_PEP_ID=MMETSP0325_2-20121206/62552_1 /ASSEMBLY_ACC=CAM_ASM_000347 /TAXON_ID=2866 /ORGANISM="Crypthecodinium cohnii, Strain Seligo" /LENGTH=109 /DNA_ID=CAMNT_0054145255 /DNA_START=95 /DNA_END=425 /DNA_ORIENTATION=-